MMLGYKSNNNVVYSSKYHVIWCPKYRRRVLVGDIAKRLEEIMQGMIQLRLLFANSYL